MLLFMLLSLVAPATAVSPDILAPPLCGTPFALTPENLGTFNSIVNGTIGPQKASSDILADLGGPKKWPRNSQNKVLIKYCFASPFARDRLEHIFREVGIGYWMTALGGPASRTTGHGLAFEEAKAQNGQPISCNLQNGDCKSHTSASYHHSTDTRVWDQRIDQNTVVVDWDHSPGASAVATAGFVGFDSRVRQPGIHKVLIAQAGLFSITHEVGHILGMAHEHQRRDRNANIEYRCVNVRSFAMSFHHLVRDNPDATHSLLCDNYITALQYGFEGHQYIAGLSAGDPRFPVHGVSLTVSVADYGEPYDVHSIMHYGSAGFAYQGAKCSETDLSECVVVKRLPGGGYGFIPPTFRPSAGDVKWVRKTYPWVDPPAGHAVAEAGMAGVSFTA